ncbi:MAG: hypothetical protein AB7G37_01755 [Solirubrobacteraceae bacterium]
MDEDEEGAAAADGRSAYRRVQVVCAWCGPAFVIGLFGGWGILGGFLPHIPASDTAEQVAAAYAERVDLRRAGLLISLVATFLTVPFFLSISLQMRRSEGRVPALAILQLASGLVICLVLLLPTLFFLVATFRVYDAPEITQMLNDLSYIVIILPFPPLLGQLIAIAASIFVDRRERPVFPRWVAYFNLWVAVLVTPAGLLMFFHDGPFAWNGLLGFWIPAAAFGLWYPVMTVVVLQAIRREADEDAAVDAVPGVAVHEQAVATGALGSAA